MADSAATLGRRIALAAGALALALTLGAAGDAQARCGDAPGDATAMAETRAAIEAQCPCAGPGTRSDYTKCARNAIRNAVAAGTLPSSCQSSVMRCVSRSTCRKPGAVTCCRTTRQGKTSCSIKKNAAQCRAPSGGHACVGHFTSCCDSCNAGGCVAPTPTPTPVPTPTPEPTATPTPTPTPTPVPVDFCAPLVGLPALAQVPMTTLPGSSDCGGPALEPPPAPPFTGDVRDGSGAKLGDLGAGCQYVGGLPPQAIIAGGTAKLDVVGIGLGSVVLGGSAGSGPGDCTRGAGPGRHCLNGRLGTDGAGACASDADCGNVRGSCALDGNCFFGPPVPVPNDFLSACSVNAFLHDLCGEVNLLSQQATFRTTVSARVYLTGDPESPCPTCDGGVCNGGKNDGEPCVAVGSAGTSNDCPPNDSQFFGVLTIPIPQLSTGNTTLQADEIGRFCEGQPGIGAIGQSDARTVSITGVGPGQGSDPTSMRLAAAFCIPPTGGPIDAVAGLPGVGAISSTGSIDLGGVLGLPLP